MEMHDRDNSQIKLVYDILFCSNDSQLLRNVMANIDVNVLIRLGGAQVDSDIRCSHIGHAMRKRVYIGMETSKVKISLRILAVWSGPSLSANWIIGYCIMYEWRAKAQLIFCAWAGWSEYAHFAQFEDTFRLNIIR